VAPSIQEVSGCAQCADSWLRHRQDNSVRPAGSLLSTSIATSGARTSWLRASNLLELEAVIAMKPDCSRLAMALACARCLRSSVLAVLPSCARTVMCGMPASSICAWRLPLLRQACAPPKGVTMSDRHDRDGLLFTVNEGTKRPARDCARRLRASRSLRVTTCYTVASPPGCSDPVPFVVLGCRPCRPGLEGWRSESRIISSATIVLASFLESIE
jgi:hypothetical protein